jgi:hypothetical protein
MALRPCSLPALTHSSPSFLVVSPRGKRETASLRGPRVKSRSPGCVRACILIRHQNTCSCDLGTELAELRPGIDYMLCTQCHNFVAFVRPESLGVLSYFRKFEAAFWAES